MGKAVDIAGKRFGILTALRRDKDRKYCWICQCDCGEEKSILQRSLTDGRTTSCGCKNGVKNLIGQRFGRLEVLHLGEFYINPTSGKQAQWVCFCDCGGVIEVLGTSLVSEKTKSCGCIRIENPNGTTHGQKGTRLYRIWQLMKDRCSNKNNKQYHDYGGRGIRVCTEWKKSFVPFYNWSLANGYREDLTIDRIHNNKGYNPKNCRWADRATQNQNRRDNKYYYYKGEELVLPEIARTYGIAFGTLNTRVNEK